MNAEVTLLHVVENEVYYTSFLISPFTVIGDFDNATFYQYINADKLSDGANYYLSEMKRHLGDSNIKTIVENGEFAEAMGVDSAGGKFYSSPGSTKSG